MSATPEQRAATDPTSPAWVGANAGSGKTQVLTQRVARLLLAGAEPQKILCLTYTKAAASEMQTRLFRTLGGWAMAPDHALAAILADLTGGSIDPDLMTRARRLFARALETPGGLKIQTIHAFCEAVLRRFPLEAGLSPRFEVADDVQSASATAQVRISMAEAADTGQDLAFDHAARQLNEGAIDDLTSAILTRRADIAATDLSDALAAVFGDAASATRQAIAAEALNQLNLPARRALALALGMGGKQAEQPLAKAMGIAETKAESAPVDAVDTLLPRILTGKHEPRSTRGFPTKATAAAHPAAADELAELTDWAIATRSKLLAVEAAERARDLHMFGQPLIARYARTKVARGMLDFDDLITRTRDLLTERTQREWVLYKLDQGIDHILVDEAQDTSPAQWQVIGALAEEFLAGQGARQDPRTLFVVGDEKQSIYSFQGAEPAAFGQMRRHFAERFEHLGRPLARPDLETSFRSAPAILDFVDRVFQGEAADGLTVDATPVRHHAHRQGERGRVDLWPLVPRPEKVEEPPWFAPIDTPPPDDAKAQLAELVASQIDAMIGTEILPPRRGEPARRVRAGDILVLVQKRDRLARGIIRGLKTRGVPVAGADRLKLAGEIAVQDLLALAKVATMPTDDLSLAALLRSPLCAVEEDELFELAHDRGESSLLDRVRNHPDYAGTAAFLDDMLAQADFLRPYEFLERALVRHDGRRRLTARLGAEAEDPIDELLAQALAFEARHPPSLAGLIDWVETSDQQVKREMDQGADLVRVMTVHGAKGLEAPVVILPDTTGKPGGGAGRQTLLRTAPDGNKPPLTIWAGAKDRDDPVTRAARDAADQRAAEERRRLLYVALTRAEDWLILCGAEPHGRNDGTWYDLIQAGMAECGDRQALPSPTGQGQMQRFETGTQAPDLVPEAAQPTAAPETLPEWLSPVLTESPKARISPSELHRHEPLGGAGLGREQAMARGTAVHALLDCAVPQDADWVATRFPDLDPALIPEILAEAQRTRAMPDAASIFAPDALSEVTLAIDPPHGGARMIGRADRLVPQPDGWLIIDFKTDAQIPDTLPDAYLAQLGAYLTALQADEPSAKITLALLWTAAPRIQSISPEIAMDAYRRSRRGL